MTNNLTGRYLDFELTVRPRFSEIDAMGIMWHGSYVKILENIREDFGAAHRMGYMDVYRNGFMTPVVHMALDYKLPIRYEENILIKARYLECKAAKIVFEYTMVKPDGRICATAETVQVFIDLDGELQLAYPDFHVSWAAALPWKSGDK